MQVLIMCCIRFGISVHLRICGYLNSQIRCSVLTSKCISYETVTFLQTLIV